MTTSLQRKYAKKTLPVAVTLLMIASLYQTTYFVPKKLQHY